MATRRARKVPKRPRPSKPEFRVSFDETPHNDHLPTRERAIERAQEMLADSEDGVVVVVWEEVAYVTRNSRYEITDARTGKTETTMPILT